MTPGLTRRGWQASAEERAKARRSALDLAQALRLLRSAEVASDRLTHMPEWDAYLRQAEAIQERDRQELAETAQLLASPDYRTAEESGRLRHLAAALQNRIAARDEILRLPQEILRHARARAGTDS